MTKVQLSVRVSQDAYANLVKVRELLKMNISNTVEYLVVMASEIILKLSQKYTIEEIEDLVGRFIDESLQNH